MSRKRAMLVYIFLVTALVSGGRPAAAQDAAAKATTRPAVTLPQLVKDRQGAGTTMQWITMVTVLSVAPALVVMVTCFTRIIVVLGLLRQALSAQQVPPNQVLFGLALLMTLVVMSPVFGGVYGDAVRPYLDGKITQDQALTVGQRHVRKFMIDQIEAADNTDDVYLFLDDKTAARADLKWQDVPTLSLIPGFAISELKVAFFMGFRIYLPFLVIDMLVASVLVSMGMLMLPPVVISLPLKLLLFVLADGWHLVVGTLMKSFT